MKNYIKKETALLAKDMGFKSQFLNDITQSELQRWLWEEKMLWVSSTPIFSSNELLAVEVSVNSWALPSIVVVDYRGFDIYEGLEIGLLEALKLLK